LNAKDKESYLRRGLLYQRQKEYRKAVRDFSKIINLDPTYRDAYFWRAACYELLGDSKKANEDKEMVRKLQQAN
jgi:Tfp pilus assembly protein PilF